MTPEPAELAEQGKHAFSIKKFDEAADLFNQAATGFELGRAGLLAAEMKNNMSVALLQGGKPQAALDAALGTDVLFEKAKDLKRQAIALGNQAAALEALRRYDEALAAYEISAKIFGEIGEGDMRSMVLKSAAAIKLKTGKIGDSAFNMIGALDAKEKPSFFERILKFLMRFSK